MLVEDDEHTPLGDEANPPMLFVKEVVRWIKKAVVLVITDDDRNTVKIIIVRVH